MLIYLTNSLITNNYDDITLIKKCVRNLCIAYEESKHLLLGDYEVLNWACHLIQDETSQLVLNKLIQEYSLSSIPRNITEYIEVGNWLEKDKIESEGIVIHRVPFSFFVDSGFCQKSCVIVEDENDYGFYEHILKWFIAGRGYNYNFKCIQGGGTNMGRTISTTLENENIAVAFVDTDIRFPGERIKVNSTCYNCQQAASAVESSSVFHLHVLNLHEIENILPFDIIIGLDWNQEDIKHFQYLIDADENGNIMRFFDIKKGIKKTNELIDSEDYLQFAQQCYLANPQLTSEMDFDARMDITDDKGIIYPGLGRPLTKIIDYFHAHDITLTPFTLLPFQEEEWNNIGQNLLNYGFSRSMEAIN